MAEVSTPRDTERDAIGLAERILAVLDEGRFSATYKFAVLSGLMDLCLENTTREGSALVWATRWCVCTACSGPCFNDGGRSRSPV